VRFHRLSALRGRGMTYCIAPSPSQALQADKPTIESIVKEFLTRQGYEARPRTLSIKVKEALIDKLTSLGVPYDSSDPHTVQMTTTAVGFAHVRAFSQTEV